MMATPKLSDIEIQRELASLAGWSRRGDELVKTFTFGKFLGGIAFVNSVAQVAEKMDHHPDLDIRYTKITAVLSTHSSGGITANDVKLAKEMDRLAS
jgi:4a-hydroxytetrahydrobiopterin dehydratase